jgi:hypothetical protein
MSLTSLSFWHWFGVLLWLGAPASVADGPIGIDYTQYRPIQAAMRGDYDEREFQRAWDTIVESAGFEGLFQRFTQEAEDIFERHLADELQLRTDL